MSDIVERLQAANEWMRAPDWNDDLELVSWLNRRPAGGFQAAIDEITRLTADNKRLTIEVEAAKKFGDGFYGEKVTEGVREVYRGFARAELSGDKHE